MNEVIKYIDSELRFYKENKNNIINDIRSIKLDIEQFEIRIKDFSESQNAGEKLFLGFNSDFDNLELKKLTEEKELLEKQLITLNQRLDFFDNKIKELHHIKKVVTHEYLIDYNAIDEIKNKLSFVAGLIVTDTNRAVIELNQICENLEDLLFNHQNFTNEEDL